MAEGISAAPMSAFGREAACLLSGSYLSRSTMRSAYGDRLTSCGSAGGKQGAFAVHRRYRIRLPGPRAGGAATLGQVTVHSLTYAFRI